MPTPHHDEPTDAYIARCMGNPEMNAKHPNEKERAAVCHAFLANYRDHGSIAAARVAGRNVVQAVRRVVTKAKEDL